MLNGDKLSGMQGVPAFFSDENLNSDNLDHTVHNDLEGLQIGFEDLVNGGDEDFDDVVIDPTIDGGSGNEYGQNDTLIGGKGNDTLLGGAGDDVAIFEGDFAKYNITVNEDGTFTVEDTIEARDGTDIIEDVEFFQFSDGSISSEELPNPGSGGSGGGQEGHDNDKDGHGDGHGHDHDIVTVAVVVVDMNTDTIIMTILLPQVMT